MLVFNSIKICYFVLLGLLSCTSHSLAVHAAGVSRVQAVPSNNVSRLSTFSSKGLGVRSAEAKRQFMCGCMRLLRVIVTLRKKRMPTKGSLHQSISNTSSDSTRHCTSEKARSLATEPMLLPCKSDSSPIKRPCTSVCAE